MSSGPLWLNEVNEVVLEPSPLALVATQIDCDLRELLVEGLGVDKLRHRLAAEFASATRHALPSDASDEAGYVNFHSSDHKLHLVITPDNLQLSTKRYTSRDDWIGLLSWIIEAVNGLGCRPSVSKVGVRYINHFHSQHLEPLQREVRQEFLGPLLFPEFPLPSKDRLISQFRTPLESGALVATWGLAGGQPQWKDIQVRSSEINWILDIDVHSHLSDHLLDPNLAPDPIRAASRVAYRFFRFATSDDMIVRRGRANDNFN